MHYENHKSTASFCYIVTNPIGSLVEGLYLGFYYRTTY